MARLATAVSVWHGAELHVLNAGDEVPDWAEELIGSHCLADEGQPEPAPEESSPTTPSEPGPDFTKPVPKRGPGRPRSKG